MVFIYFFILVLIIIVIIYLGVYTKINVSGYIKLAKKNNTKKLLKNINKIRDINEKTLFQLSSVKVEKTTPLMASIICQNDVEVIKELIQCGANVNEQDENLNTAFLYAALYYKNPEIFDILIQAGADKNTKNILDANALMISLYNDDISILKKIISLGIDINCQNKGGWSGLMSIALDARPVEMAKVLIENGADINLKNAVGKTALDIAKEYENKEMTDFLCSIIEQ